MRTNSFYECFSISCILVISKSFECFETHPRILFEKRLLPSHIPEKKTIWFPDDIRLNRIEYPYQAPYRTRIGPYRAFPETIGFPYINYRFTIDLVRYLNKGPGNLKLKPTLLFSHQ